jgi:hypothetical protein
MKILYFTIENVPNLFFFRGGFWPVDFILQQAQLTTK